jgi:hypothetical protein
MTIEIEEAIESGDLVALYEFRDALSEGERVTLNEMIYDIALEKLEDAFSLGQTLDLEIAQERAILRGVYEYAFICLEQANHHDATACFEQLADVCAKPSFKVAMQMLEAVAYKEVDMPSFFKYYCHEHEVKEDFYYVSFKEEVYTLLEEVQSLKS